MSASHVGKHAGDPLYDIDTGARIDVGVKSLAAHGRDRDINAVIVPRSPIAS
jgi:hypothetical protein